MPKRIAGSPGPGLSGLSVVSNWSLWWSKLPPGVTKKICRLTPSAWRPAIIIATERSCIASGLLGGNTVAIGNFSTNGPNGSGPS